MVRSMYSGISGMKSHQVKMDVIGNNISNVNTVGFKSSRTTFKDVYYSSMRSPTGSSSSRGGVNPSQVGYGSALGSIDVIQSRGTLSLTDRGLDAMIVGEGFYQVMDGEGNTFYTKAGSLTIDPSGNLVDSNGYFVLGVSGNPLGQSPSSNKIQVNIPSVEPSSSEAEAILNGSTFTFEGTNANSSANLTMNFESDKTLPLGQKIKAEITNSGITVKLNPNETFATLGDLQTAMNNAITEANGGKEHPAGQISIKCANADKLFATPLTGEEIASKDFAPTPGKIEGLPSNLFGGLTFDSTNGMFAGDKMDKMDCKYMPAIGAPTSTPAYFEVSTEINGKTYKGKIPSSATGSGKVLLQELDGSGAPIPGAPSLTFKHPGYTSMYGALKTEVPTLDGKTEQPFTTANIAAVKMTPTQASKALGFGSNPIKLVGGTKGGPQTIEDCSSVSIGGDGILEAIHPVHGRLQLGRIDLANFQNPQGLEQAGNSYFTATSNSGNPTPSIPGSGGVGALQSSALESSNVDLSREFSDMIITQRGFQANSRLITVSDTMLEELVNLKR